MASGIATFGIAITSADTGYQLTADCISGGQVFTDTSTTFDITFGALTSYLVMPDSPMTIAVADMAVMQTTTITAIDAYGNTVKNVATTLTMSTFQANGTPAITFYTLDGVVTTTYRTWSNGALSIYWNFTTGVVNDEMMITASDDNIPAITGLSDSIKIVP